MNSAIMIPMSEFVKVGGMDTLLKHAIAVHVGDITPDTKEAGNYYVDIRFRLNTAVEAPFFGEKDLVADTDQARGSPAPTKLVSILSSDGPVSTEVEVINPRSSDPASNQSPASEQALSAGSSGLDGVEDAPQEAVYMPDEMWIARTQTLSSLLKEREAETPTANVSVCDAVHAVRPRDKSVSRLEDDSFDYEFAMLTPQADTDTESCCEPQEEGIAGKQKLNEILSDPSAPSKLDSDLFNKLTAKKESRDGKTAVDTATRAASTAENDHTSVQDAEVPKGCGLLRASSLKAAVQTIRRSFSRDSAAHSARANRTTSHTEVRTADIRHDVSEDEIQPNHVPPNVPVAINPDPPVARAETEWKERTGEQSGNPVGSLLRKTSNLARNLFRKLSSSDPKEADRRVAATEDKGGAKEDPRRLGKRRSLFRKRGPRGENAVGQSSATAEGQNELGHGQNKLMKRRSLVFGRRYKEQ